MATNFNMRLDVRKAATNIPQIRLGQGDNQTTLTVEILDEGAAYTYAEGDTLEFACVRPDGHWVHLGDACTKSGTKWVCKLDDHVTEAAGLVSIAYFVIKGADGFARESTDRFELVIEPSGTGHADLSPYSDQVDRLLRQCEALYSSVDAKVKEWEANENTRKENEAARVSAEEARVTAETARATAETNRASAESTRQSNEQTRIANENSRIAAEIQRNERIESYISIFNGFLADVSGVMGSSYYRDELVCVPIAWATIDGENDTMYVSGEYDAETTTLWLVAPSTGESDTPETPGTPSTPDTPETPETEQGGETNE